MMHGSPADKKRGFNIHALVFILTMALLAVTNLLTGPSYWVLWVLLVWTVGLVFHGWFVVGPGAKKENP